TDHECVPQPRFWPLRMRHCLSMVRAALSSSYCFKTEALKSIAPKGLNF
ncbi:hypothetical protein chiPu_0030168, partial [Chiloscyllium punctatum]|nr:hypothetical protein [Chiloscyllium punctatum]